MYTDGKSVNKTNLEKMDLGNASTHQTVNPTAETHQTVNPTAETG